MAKLFQSIILYKKAIASRSDYIVQNSVKTDFKSYGSDSWIILSEIEKSIKEKIEKIGVPLKDWDINIYRGVLTGYNEAFIINGQKKEEILNNCKTEEERLKTVELIRPILRGRDIKRYSYDFADLYLIATFPSLKIDIEEYPAVKEYLMNFGYDRLKQTGEKGARKKTNNKWFETQDTISYWEDFNKQKIAWNRIASEKQFALVDEGIFIQDSMHFFTGNHLYYLSAFLNSKSISWLLGLIVGEAAGGNAGNSDNIRNLKIPYPSTEFEDKITEYLKNENFNKIDDLIYKLFEFNDEEIVFIQTQ